MKQDDGSEKMLNTHPNQLAHELYLPNVMIHHSGNKSNDDATLVSKDVAPKHDLDSSDPKIPHALDLVSKKKEEKVSKLLIEDRANTSWSSNSDTGSSSSESDSSSCSCSGCSSSSNTRSSEEEKEKNMEKENKNKVNQSNQIKTIITKIIKHKFNTKHRKYGHHHTIRGDSFTDKHNKKQKNNDETRKQIIGKEAEDCEASPKDSMRRQKSISEERKRDTNDSKPKKKKETKKDVKKT